MKKKKKEKKEEKGGGEIKKNIERKRKSWNEILAIQPFAMI